MQPLVAVVEVDQLVTIWLNARPISLWSIQCQRSVIIFLWLWTKPRISKKTSKNIVIFGSSTHSKTSKSFYRKMSRRWTTKVNKKLSKDKIFCWKAAENWFLIWNYSIRKLLISKNFKYRFPKSKPQLKKLGSKLISGILSKHLKLKSTPISRFTLISWPTNSKQLRKILKISIKEPMSV